MLCSVWLLDPDRIHVRAIAAPNLPESYIRAIDGFVVGPAGGSCGAAVTQRQSVFVTDVLTDPVLEQLRDIITAHGLRACWSAPIVSHRGEILGTFAFYFRSVRAPSPSDLELIETATRIAGIAIERKLTEDALRSSEEELRRITDLIPQKIIVLNPDGRAIYANRVCMEYSGLSLDEVRAEDFRARVFHPEDIERLAEERQKGLSGTVPFENEQRARGKDGKYRWLLIQYNPFLDESGKVIRWYATGTDIEDRKRAEEKLRHEERELRQLIDFLPQHVLVLDANGYLLQANQVMLNYTGRTLEEMRGAGTKERIKRDLHPDDLERARAERDRGLSRGVPFEIEKRLLGKDGRYRWFLFRYNPLRNEEGQIARWFATATDIEDRKQAEVRIRNETVALREEIVRSSMFEEIVGSSNALRKVLEQVAKVAPTDSTVLIQGETGTGKELIARAIHNRSKRASRAFIRVNCSAIPASLIASELFGHEKGSFTGALHRRTGRFESADGGTIFLDEIGELPPETQVALLRVLQERELERVGGNQSIPVDVRVLAATNKDLSAAVAEGMFRKDLFYRLNVFPIQLPPLRDRVDDIPLLVEYLVGRYAEKAGKRIQRISKKTLSLFESYDWPGNIRELQNVIERAVILSDGETFCVDTSWLTPATPLSAEASALLVADLAEREKAMIENALREARGLISGTTGAAAKLGVPRQTLESKIRKLGIDRHRFKSS
jgi:formate hydrogenlyase transcriptional activator